MADDRDKQKRVGSGLAIGLIIVIIAFALWALFQAMNRENNGIDMPEDDAIPDIFQQDGIQEGEPPDDQPGTIPEENTI